jgi:hypothetical protein
VPVAGALDQRGVVDLVCLYHRDRLVIDDTMMSTWGGAPVSIALQM